MRGVEKVPSLYLKTLVSGGKNLEPRLVGILGMQA